MSSITSGITGSSTFYNFVHPIYLSTIGLNPPVSSVSALSPRMVPELALEIWRSSLGTRSLREIPRHECSRNNIGSRFRLIGLNMTVLVIPYVPSRL